MKEFKFKQAKEARTLTIRIDSKEFTFNPLTYNVKKAIEKFVIVNKTLENKLNNEISEEEMNKVVVQSCDLVRETINKILGQKSYDTIFGGRTVDFEENQQVVGYIFECITEFSAIVKNEHTSN